MSELAVLCPVLGRPHRVEPTINGFRETVPDARILFIASPDDSEELEVLASADVDTLIHDGNYAAKIRAGLEHTDEPLLFFGADDLLPQPAWFEAARSRLSERIEVVGVNDLIKRRGRIHATHFLVTRDYARMPTIDGKPGPFFEGYTHSFTDDEFIATATKRRAYRYMRSAQVQHLHPMSGGEDDDTYRLGRRHFRRDRALWVQRRRLHRL